ncbi:MAG: peptide chain release factor N(5)-glutamine methyltransferase, partial [Opitutaceae bacterium]
MESARLNAELLIGHALELKRMQLYLQFERMLTEPELGKIRPLVKRRSQREPLQYIIGTVEFGGLKLKVDRRALIPRPETERLIEIVVELCPKPPARVLDLGTGTGAIALALAKAFPEAHVTAVDVSPEALALASENILASGFGDRVRLDNSAWFNSIPANSTYDLIVSKPPYLTDAETDETSPEVRGHEPRSALVSGSGGLADLREIICKASPFLAAGGLMALETGITQHAELVKLSADQGFERVESRRDLT